MWHNGYLSPRGSILRILHCFAEERDGQWEALCLDLDIAVQSSTFEDLVVSMKEAIKLYVESVGDLPPEERARLLHRVAPLSVRLRFLLAVARSMLFQRGGEPLPFAVPSTA